MGRVLGMVAGAGLLLAALGGAHAAPPPPPRLPRLPSLRTSTDAPTVQQHPDGTLRRVDEEGRFQGIIHPDGRVELRDLPDARVEFETGIRTVDWMLGFARAVERPGSHDRLDLETPTPDRDDERARLEAATVEIDHGPYGPPPILERERATTSGDLGGPRARTGGERRRYRSRDSHTSSGRK